MTGARAQLSTMTSVAGGGDDRLVIPAGPRGCAVSTLMSRCARFLVLLDDTPRALLFDGIDSCSAKSSRTTASSSKACFATPKNARCPASPCCGACRATGAAAADALLRAALSNCTRPALAVGLLTDPELDRHSASACGHKIELTRLELVYLALPALMSRSHLCPAFRARPARPSCDRKRNDQAGSHDQHQHGNRRRGIACMSLARAATSMVPTRRGAESHPELLRGRVGAVRRR